MIETRIKWHKFDPEKPPNDGRYLVKMARINNPFFAHYSWSDHRWYHDDWEDFGDIFYDGDEEGLYYTEIDKLFEKVRKDET